MSENENESSSENESENENVSGNESENENRNTAPLPPLLPPPADIAVAVLPKEVNLGDIDIENTSGEHLHYWLLA